MERRCRGSGTGGCAGALCTGAVQGCAQGWQYRGAVQGIVRGVEYRGAVQGGVQYKGKGLCSAASGSIETFS